MLVTDDKMITFGFLIVLFLQLSNGSTFSAVGCSNPCFLYMINNQLEEPYFKHVIHLDIQSAKDTMIRYMEKAVLLQPGNFTRFSATFSSPYGYFIDSINGVAGNWPEKKTYWQILNQSGPLTVGVSTYVPQKGDQILFNLTKGSE